MIATPHRPRILASYLPFDDTREAMLEAFAALCHEGIGAMAAEIEIKATADAMREVAR